MQMLRKLTKRRAFSKLSLYIILFVFCITLITTIVSMRISSDIIKSETNTLNLTFLNKLSNLIDNKIADIDRNIVQFYMNNIDSKNINRVISDPYERSLLYDKIQELSGTNEFIDSIYIFYNGGKEVYFHSLVNSICGVAEITDFYDRQVYESFIKSNLYLGISPAREMRPVYIDGVDSYLNAAARVVTYIKKFPVSTFGKNDALAVNIKEQYLLDLIGDNYIPKKSMVLISDRNSNTILFYCQTKNDKDKIDDLKSIINLEVKNRTGEDSTSFTVSYGGDRYYVTELKNEQNGRVYTLITPEKELLKPIYRVNIYLFALSNFILFLGIAFSALVDRKFFHPILNILQTLKNRVGAAAVTGQENNGKSGNNEFTQIAGYIDKIITRNQDQEKQLQSYFSFYKDKVLLALLNGDSDMLRMHDEDKILTNLEYNYFAVILADMKRARNANEEACDDEFLNASMQEIHEKLQQFGQVEKVRTGRTENAFLLCTNETVDVSVLLEIIRAAAAGFSDESRKIKAGIGNVYCSITEIKESFREAERSLRHVLESESDPAVYVCSMTDLPADNYTYPDNLEGEIIKEFVSGGHEGIRSGIGTFCGYMKEKGVGLRRAKKYALRLIYNISLSLDKAGKGCRNSLAVYNVFDEIEMLASLNDIEEWLGNLLDKCIGKAERSVDISNRELVDKVINYINNRYMEDIGLNTIAEYVYLSPSYFGKIFKEVTGHTFIDCLTRVRMEAAAQPLKNGDLKINDVYEKVGYFSIQSFSKAFKGYYGCTPGEFRKKEAADFLGG